MRLLTFSCVTFVLCVLPMGVRAQVVISEVLWPGSDLSTGDEWLELASVSQTDTDLSGWTITSLNTKGEHAVALTFAAGSILVAGESVIISSHAASASRLLSEPAFVTSALSLPNTKLLLRLRDAAGVLIDEVDDGVGAPFAGANPSGTGAKASMERIDLLAPGTVKENWRTSTQSLGFDDGANVLGSPGFFVEMETEEANTEVVQSSSSSSSTSSSSSACSDPLQIAISIQSGPVSGIGKVTVNMQAAATQGSLGSTACSWNFGDGFTSVSCNPAAHSFTDPGVYMVRLEAKNQCGITLVQEQKIEVFPDSSLPISTTFYDGSRLMFSGALPNPEGADTSKEWIEIHNPEDRPVDLAGWKLSVGETSVQSYMLKGSLPPGDDLRIFDSEIKFKLPNTASKLRLITPAGTEMSSIVWSSTDEGRTYFSDDIREVPVSGTVIKFLGKTSFELLLDAEARAAVDNDRLIIRLLGVRPATSDERTSISQDESQDIKYIQALLEKKKVELEFDTMLWDEQGSLMAYVFGDGALSIQEYLLSSGRFMTDDSIGFLRKKRFEDLEKTTSIAHGARSDSLFDMKQTAHAEAVQAAIVDASGVSISEVFSSPYPPSDRSHEGLMKSEWIELWNSSQHAVDLSSVALRIDGTKKLFKNAPRIASGSFLVLRISDIGGRLKNTGGSVAILNAQGSVISEVTYPELKNGYSFAVTSAVVGSCVTASPTPGTPNQCMTMSNQKKTAPKTNVATTKKVSPQVKAYAASYRAQVIDEDPGPTADIVFEDAPSAEASIGLLVATFIAGLGFAMLAGFFVARKNWF